MKILDKFSIVLIALMFMSMKGDKPSSLIFDVEGHQVKYSAMLKTALNANIVFFGELHNNPISHWMQIELLKDLYAEKQDKLVLGAEMFESDIQLLIDEYLSGQIKTESFESESKLWKNYKTDYKPLVEFAKENELKFVATNVPRRYASLVNEKGFEGLDSLNNEAKKLIAPLPLNYDSEVNCYKSMVEMMKEMGNHDDTLHIAKAQAIKDATMAHFILKNLKNGETFIHFNGAYHSDDYEGIVWWIKQTNSNLNIMTISTVEQDTITNLSEEFIGVADYILCVPSNMTKRNSAI